MKVIIAGSRTIHDYWLVGQAIGDAQRRGLAITEVVSGCAGGVDMQGERWAAVARVPVTQFPANWRLYGKSAGPRRNRMMAEYADAVILVWDGTSRGTHNMWEEAQHAELPIYPYIWEGDHWRDGYAPQESIKS